MFAAGMLPGLMLKTVFLVTILIWVRLDPAAAGSPGASPPTSVSLAGVVSLIGLVVLVLRGLYAGLFTPTEAAAVGTIGTFVIALLRGGLTRRNFAGAMIESAATSAMIFLIIIGSTLYGTFLSVTGLSSTLRDRPAFNPNSPL